MASQAITEPGSASLLQPKGETETDLAKFNRLKLEWLRTQIPSSKLRDLVLSMAYQHIIGMGKPAVPLLINELRQTPRNWFWALEAITEENPIPPNAEGDFDQMRAAWLDWAQRNGF